MIIGRENELSVLRGLVKAEYSEFVAVYGRRRVGKTFLVREAFDYSFTFQHTGIATKPKAIQLEAFRRSLIDAGFSNCPHLENWFDAFDALKVIITNSRKHKKVIFIDEISWMDTPKADFLSCFEQFWNGWASARKDVVLIICASATSWIISKVLKNRGGLHNRVTRKLHIRPFILKECEEYLAARKFRISRKQIITLYMILGGVAYYWSLLEKGKSVVQNINELFFTEDAKLKDEFNALYDSLFKNPEQYKTIVTALASKGKGLTRQELISDYGLDDNGALSIKLEELENCDLIRRYNAFGKDTKDALYQMIDNFTLFHYRFIRENRSGDDQFWINNLGSGAYNAWAGIAFERVCLQHIQQIKNALGIGGVATSQSSWHADKKLLAKNEKGAQIDLLLDRKDEIINICEMKWCPDLYAMDKSDWEDMRNKQTAFIRECKPGKSVNLTMVTTFGVKKNSYYDEIQSEVTADQFFV